MPDDPEMDRLFYGETSTAEKPVAPPDGKARTLILMPGTKKMLKFLGSRLKLARLRRRMTLASLAERAQLSKPTVMAVEKRSPTTSMGAYAVVLFCLGLDHDIAKLAADPISSPHQRS